MKRKAVAAALAGSKAITIYTQSGNDVHVKIQRRGEWSEEDKTVDGIKREGETKDGVLPCENKALPISH